VEALAQDLQRQECAAGQRALDLESDNSALRAQLAESEVRTKTQQVRLEEALHKLDALTTVRDALVKILESKSSIVALRSKCTRALTFENLYQERQTHIMSDEAVQIQQQLRLAVSDPEKNQLRHQLQVRPPRLHSNTHRLSLPPSLPSSLSGE
jgi:ParB-like chromosome segregation protein Spo0J